MFNNIKDRLNNIKEKQHNGVNNEDEAGREVVTSNSNNSSNSSGSGLFRRPIQPTRLQNSSASIKSEDSDSSKVDMTLLEDEDDEIKSESYSNEKEKGE